MLKAIRNRQWPPVHYPVIATVGIVSHVYVAMFIWNVIVPIMMSYLGIETKLAFTMYTVIFISILTVAGFFFAIGFSTFFVLISLISHLASHENVYQYPMQKISSNKIFPVGQAAKPYQN